MFKDTSKVTIPGTSATIMPSKMVPAAAVAAVGIPISRLENPDDIQNLTFGEVQTLTNDNLTKILSAPNDIRFLGYMVLDALSIPQLQNLSNLQLKSLSSDTITTLIRNGKIAYFLPDQLRTLLSSQFFPKNQFSNLINNILSTQQIKNLNLSVPYLKSLNIPLNILDQLTVSLDDGRPITVKPSPKAMSLDDGRPITVKPSPKAMSMGAVKIQAKGAVKVVGGGTNGVKTTLGG